MQLKENLKLIEIKRNDKNTAVELYFFDETEKKIYSVNMSTQKWNKNTETFEDNFEKEVKVNEIAEKEFGTMFCDLESAVGKTHNIYVYDDKERPFNSLFEINQINIPNDDFYNNYREGIETNIDNIEDTGERIRVVFKIDGKDYQSSNSIDGKKFRYGNWIESEKKFFPNALLEKNAFINFSKVFGVSFDEKDQLIGQKIKVFPEKAGKNCFLVFKII